MLRKIAAFIRGWRLILYLLVPAAFIRGRRLILYLLVPAAFIRGRRLFERGVYSNNYGNSNFEKCAKPILFQLSSNFPSALKLTCRKLNHFIHSKESSGGYYHPSAGLY